VPLAPEPTPYETEIYKTLAQSYDNEETIFWARNNLLVALQGAMLAGAVAIMGSFAKEAPAGAVDVNVLGLFKAALQLLCFVGLATAVAWIVMVRRSAYISHVIAARLEELEAFFHARYTLDPLLAIYTHWNAALKFDRKTRRDQYATPTPTAGQRPNGGYALGGFRLSHVWTSVGLLFLVTWAFLMIRVSCMVVQPKIDDDRGGNPPAPVGQLFALTQFAAFDPGLAERNCESGDIDGDAMTLMLRAISKATKLGLSPLVILIGGTDRTPLSPRLRRQYESNDGLAQARAVAIKKCLLATFEGDARESVRFVALNAGPAYTPSARGTELVDQREQERDRSVQALVLGLPRNP
jgi:hypothetical protein